jgi:hypothetical protein
MQHVADYCHHNILKINMATKGAMGTSYMRQKGDQPNDVNNLSSGKPFAVDPA